MSTAIKIDRIAIIGVGLIGGSLALVLKQVGAVNKIIGYCRSRESGQLALDLGVIDHLASTVDEAVTQADVVVLATPVGAMPSLLEAVAKSVGPEVVITDVGSVKQSISKAAGDALGKHAHRFVPGHPVAGAEYSGVSAAKVDLFRGKRVILTPQQDADLQACAVVQRMWQAAGAEVIEMSAKQHDEILAATSHLPHVLAFALVDWLAQQDRGDLFDFAAGGFYDFTRIASSDPAMWRDICVANKQQLLIRLQDFQKAIGDIAGLIDSENADELMKIFERAKAARDLTLPQRSDSRNKK
ncbi:MAG TPA: prephenate dehydrogenase/arogenate dehydrogenase family protein [Acidiferrobacteraceae bacterium]|nr:prephenate dehydrogenase/arogenate dehydrogenase family protein [Acidiferrobacteraceae bacterium]